MLVGNYVKLETNKHLSSVISMSVLSTVTQTVFSLILLNFGVCEVTFFIFSNVAFISFLHRSYFYLSSILDVESNRHVKKQWFYCVKKGSIFSYIHHYYRGANMIINEPGHEKMCLMSYANNKGADQPAHPRSLISAFIVRCVDSIICRGSKAEISRL